jgi:hypothetical protein
MCGVVPVRAIAPLRRGRAATAGDEESCSEAEAAARAWGAAVLGSSAGLDTDAEGNDEVAAVRGAPGTPSLSNLHHEALAVMDLISGLLQEVER